MSYPQRGFGRLRGPHWCMTNEHYGFLSCRRNNYRSIDPLTAGPTIPADGTDCLYFVGALDALHIQHPEDQDGGFATRFAAASTSYTQQSQDLPYPIYSEEDDILDLDVPPETKNRNRNRKGKGIDIKRPTGHVDAQSYTMTYGSNTTVPSYDKDHERHRSSRPKFASQDEEAALADMSTHNLSSDSTYSVPYRYPTMISEHDLIDSVDMQGQDVRTYSEVNPVTEGNTLVHDDEHEVEMEWVVVDEPQDLKVSERQRWWSFN
ncbi:hypothetical protein QBC38DRAFT_279156 [Podospora fimiseda]|uniref:Uncharacterized protein n=1 Tax=Podospora fimiseda TaxID=252190 RepID=A0AAN7BWY1_9PEZI|nr:hypothetical protein QBC38DRAFT_279156 [Podospora fimiseda]